MKLESYRGFEIYFDHTMQPGSQYIGQYGQITYHAGTATELYSKIDDHYRILELNSCL